jgi:hypothetical protein
LLDGEETNIPVIGDFKLEHIGSEYHNGKVEASVVVEEYKFDSCFRRNVVQMKNADDPEIYKAIKSRIRETFGEYLKKE